MRKARVRRGMKKIDLVVTSARYQGAGQRLLQARGFERRGQVWSDTQLIDREALALRLQRGERVVAGREAALPGDYEIGPRLALSRDRWIIVEGSDGGRDDLGVPLF